MKRLKIFRKRWKRFSSKAALWQSRIILTIIYFTLITPLALLLKLKRLRKKRLTSFWRKREATGEPIIQDLRRQF